MQSRRTLPTDRRPRTRPEPDLATAARAWGVLAGIGGLVHGIGEVAQGNVTTTTLFIPSWTTGPIADNLGGEPGLTVIPNLLATGLLTAALALLLTTVALRPARGPAHGWVLVGLSTLMLLVGGGVGPPAIGLCAGAAAIAAQRRRARGQRVASRVLWSWLFWLSLIDIVFLVLGSLFAAVVLDVDISNAFVYAFLAAVVLLPITIVVGERSTREGAAA